MKKKNTLNQLTFSQKAVYGVFFMIAIMIPIAALVGWIVLKDNFVFSNKQAIAYRDTPILFALFIPVLLLFLSIILPLKWRYEDSVPLFQRKEKKGNRKLNNKNAKKNRVIISCILCIIIVINIITFIFPFFQRIELRVNGDIVRYGIINNESSVFQSEQIDSVELSIKKFSPTIRTFGGWTLSIKITSYSGDSYSFDMGDFCNLETMINFVKSIKKEGKLTCFGGEYLENFICKYNLQDEYKTELYSIFHMSE